MKFEDGEITERMLFKKMIAKYKLKTNGKPFTMQDIRQWVYLKKVPLAYGGQLIETRTHHEFKFLKLVKWVEDEFIEIEKDVKDE